MKPFKSQPLWIAALLLAATTVASAQPVVVEDREPTLVVTGRGQVQAAPDRAIVSFGAVAQAEDAATAQVEVNEIMQAAIDAIKGEDIEDNKLSTSNLNLHPIYDQKSSRERVTAYRASYTLTVVVDDIEKAGDVIDAGLESGINQFQGVRFTLKDDTAARIDALKQASKDAATKAEAIADALGVKILGVKRITESGDYYQPPQPMYAVRGGMAMAAEMDTPVQAGELNINASVTVEYEIAPAE